MSNFPVLYKVLNKNREAFHKSGQPFKWPTVRRWTKSIPNPEACVQGYPLVTASNLYRWLADDAEIWVAEGSGAVDTEDASSEGKYCFEKARLLERVGVLTPFVLRLWMADCAEQVVKNTASVEHPDGHPSILVAIKAARDSAHGLISAEDLSAAESAAWSAEDLSAAWSAAWPAAESAAESAALSAAESAAWSAAWSAAESAAESAAWSAAESAAWSEARSAAWSAARSAAWSAALSAARSWQYNRLLELLREQTLAEAQETHKATNETTLSNNGSTEAAQ